MSGTLKVLFTVLLSFIFGCSAAWSVEPQPRIAIGFSAKSFPDVDAKDAHAAIKLWASEIGTQAKMQPESMVYPDVRALLADYRKDQIDFMSIPAVDYFRNEGNLSGVPGFVGVRKGKKTERYVILTTADKGAASILSLKKRKLALVSSDDLGTLFLNTMLLRQHQPEMDRFFSVVESKPKHSQAIHAVYFGSADACVVPERAFHTMAELNPQVGKKLKILASSPELISGVAIFRKGYPKAFREKTESITGDLKNNPRGKQILTLFQFDDLAVMRETDLADMRNLYREYRRLKGRLL